MKITLPLFINEWYGRLVLLWGGAFKKKKNVARWPMSAGLLLIVIAAADYRKICIPTLDSEHN